MPDLLESGVDSEYEEMAGQRAPKPGQVAKVDRFLLYCFKQLCTALNNTAHYGRQHYTALFTTTQHLIVLFIVLLISRLFLSRPLPAASVLLSLMCAPLRDTHCSRYLTQHTASQTHNILNSTFCYIHTAASNQDSTPQALYTT